VAQELEVVCPDMVSQYAGYIDGAAVDDIRAVNTSNLSFVLVNAVKTLSAQNDALLARIEALESARTVTTQPAPRSK
jgi:hypothetical protein